MEVLFDIQPEPLAERMAHVERSRRLILVAVVVVALGTMHRSGSLF